MEQIEIDGLRVAYERAGHGPPLVLLHGYVGDGRTTWRRQIEELADEFTVVAWDAPTLLIYGDNDERAPLNVAEDLRASIPTSRLVVLPGAGHVCNIEASDQFNREVRNFLRSYQR